MPKFKIVQKVPYARIKPDGSRAPSTFVVYELEDGSRRAVVVHKTEVTDADVEKAIREREAR